MSKSFKFNFWKPVKKPRRFFPGHMPKHLENASSLKEFDDVKRPVEYAKKYTVYHGTSKSAVEKIKKEGFKSGHQLHAEGKTTEPLANLSSRIYGATEKSLASAYAHSYIDPAVLKITMPVEDVGTKYKSDMIGGKVVIGKVYAHDPDKIKINKEEKNLEKFELAGLRQLAKEDRRLRGKSFYGEDPTPETLQKLPGRKKKMIRRMRIRLQKLY